MKTTIGLVDDHQLFLKSLGMMLESFGYEIVLEALNGKELQQRMRSLNQVPELMLIDVNMPEMNGVETARWLNEFYPSTRLVALSMNDKDMTIVSMIKAGCCAYLLKDTHPTELEKALEQVMKQGYYNAGSTQGNMRRLLLSNEEIQLKLTPKEQQFLQYACSELTYKGIAAQMQLSERTIDGYREALFQKLNVQSRVGLCMEALRRELVQL